MLNEPIEVFLDCWRKVFSLKTLGGGYVRYFILFAPSGFVKIETSHVNNVPPWRGQVLHETFGIGDPASHIFWGALLTMLEKILENKVGDGKNEIRKLGEIPTVGEFIGSLNELCRAFKIRKAEVKGFIPYYMLEGVKVKREGKEGIKLEVRQNGRKETYEARLENQVEREKTIDRLNRLIGYSRFKVL